MSDETTKGSTMSNLPRDEDGNIETSAAYGLQWAVRITYNTDPEGNWVEYEDWGNSTLHGCFDTQEQANEWLIAYPDGDKDVKDMDVIGINRVRPIPEGKTFTVTVTGCTPEQAVQVMAERISPDEDYGFDYSIDFKDNS
jgi:hypothetical protein